MGRDRDMPEETDMNQPVAVPEVRSADLPAGVFLLDVREDDEWTAGHAPEAVHVRLGDLGARGGGLPRDREIYVICRSGARSAYAAQTLAGGGVNTVNVADGMTGWVVAGRPMISEDGTDPHVAYRSTCVRPVSAAGRYVVGRHLRLRRLRPHRQPLDSGE